jgi:putative transposase
MKKTKFTEAQIVFAVKQAENGVKIPEVCRQMGISEATFYNWKKKCGGLGVGELRQLRQLQEENAKLKQIVADLSLDKQMLQDVLKKMFEEPATSGVGRSPDVGLPGVDAESLSDHSLSSFQLPLSIPSSGRPDGKNSNTGDRRDTRALWRVADLYSAAQRRI